MLYPSIDSLLTKIDSKYSLVSVAAKRARNLQETDDYQLTKYVSHKNVGRSLEEIYAGKLTFTNEPKKGEPISE
ncbi:DNA-directed RNA polymerase subunit omega [Neobacillus sp. LXY-4]|uniref:DNA-directed RNA polymerase subunit omega n=1 Tax=Neobacillus sp. LXY-4 TaxID=3379826 RepID=UPI003EE052AF